MLGVLSPRDPKLREQLAMQRVCAARAGGLRDFENRPIVRNRENWVVMWVDTGHAVSVDGGVTTAYRGIDTEGRLMWLVRHERKRHGYHSLERLPHLAIEEAITAWERRKQVRAEWSRVEQIAFDLLVGRRAFDVTLEDAHNSPLCSVGIEAFLRRMRMARVNAISGRTASLLMKIEPQMGFVIHEAWLRTEQQSPAVALPRRGSMQQAEPDLEP